MPVKPDEKDLRGALSRITVLIITVVSCALLILNVVLIAFYVRRRGARKHLLGN
jgi:hypothetical protein